MPTGYTKPELTLELKNLILDFVRENNASPTGIWRDFQCVHRSWRNLQSFVDARLLDPTDVPDEPNPSDYPDTSSAATVTCPEACCDKCRGTSGCRCANCTGI